MRVYHYILWLVDLMRKKDGFFMEKRGSHCVKRVERGVGKLRKINMLEGRKMRV